MFLFANEANDFVVIVTVDEVKLAVPVWRFSEWEGQPPRVTAVIALLLWDMTVEVCVCVCPGAAFLWCAMNNEAWCPR